ncbi:MAG: cell surface protein SprA [Dysgonamonadaceae bacterium]|jgi:cell surface protein SprA|nr:cell surface protein SprA [Dysgonamonadaceae bacterium]
MRFRSKIILFLFALLLTKVFAQAPPASTANPAPQTPAKKAAASDTVPRFPVAKVIPEQYKDIVPVYPIDLKTPEPFSSKFEYNPLTNRYELHSKIGGTDVVTPINLTPDEYLKYTSKLNQGLFYKEKYDEEFSDTTAQKKKDVLSMFDFNFDLGPADKLFGPGGVKINADGSLTTKFGITHTSTGNPTLSERQRNRTSFDFDTQVNTNFSASVGDKLNFDLNYNTESTFDFDTKKLKLGYSGKEDEIVKTLEFGNVSMTTSNSLIRGGAALFGAKTELQFGKLKVAALFSQQKTQARTVSATGNVQTTAFEVAADQYDENMHFFLSHYFYSIYDDALRSLPYIRSGINIDRIEVWITNRRSDFSEARNIVAFADLAEHDFAGNSAVNPAGSEKVPSNKANDLYQNIVNNYSAARDISSVTSIFDGSPFIVGQDFEKIENARKLSASDYTLNSQLGYISLRTALQPDEVLAVAYSYTYNGQVYQVGEFSTDSPGNTSSALFVKLLKGTSFSPSSYTWPLMMKNIYSITGGQTLDSDKFRFNVKYRNDSIGVAMNYISEGAIANKLLIRVENLDRLDARNEPYPDGYFDFISGLTVYPETGKIIFPVVEPFGSHLRKMIADDAIADKYVFQELYDSTLTVAQQTAEKNKFILDGEYKGSGSSSGGIQLDGYGIDRTSVTVTANGIPLREGVDYIYSDGNVSIINPAYTDANIQIQSESQDVISMQRKTMMGLDLNYAFTPKFNIGATIMNLSEMPMTMKNAPGEESINNTLFGFNTNFATQSQALTNLVDKLPFIELTQPSQITFSAEYARLIPGHYKSKYGGDYSYIDDFENAKNPIDLRNPYSWTLAATPAMFPESKLVNNINYGKNRALLAWYYIDGLFTRKSSLTPTHIKNDLDQLSNHYVREILESELFPDKDVAFTESATIPVLNLAYYPKERGPYNLDATNINSEGELENPQNRWGGVTRRIESSYSDFEAQNIETLEFWLLDPFIYDKNSAGGDLYFNLGEISEDVLKDEKKFFENGLPIDGDTTKLAKTVWGVVPTMQSTVYAFDNSAGARKLQDVGLNGLSTADEFNFPTYQNYLEELKTRLSPQTIDKWEKDPLSPLNDPSGDTYHYFRGSDFDLAETPILARYKHYNGTEGNSADNEDSPENYNTAARLVPDVEDINQDNTLNENESYYQYRISIRPENMNVGENYIVQKVDVKPYLKNGKDETVTWYQFKIPLREYKEKSGNIRDFKSIRFMRMFLTNFADSVILRFGTMELVSGKWRVYTKDLSNPDMPATGDASISLSTVNIEESGSKSPVNYIMPPGVNRIIDPGATQLRQQNEQSLSMQVTNLSPGDAKAVYKQAGLDARQYRRIQMFSHAESLPDDVTNLQDNDLSIFLRLGSDYKNNYYEYEIPVQVTPPGHYSEGSSSAQNEVWPESNMFDFPFELLTNLKLARNRQKNQGNTAVNLYTPFSDYDPDKPMNKITVVGNPSISDIKVVMIGVRNNSRSEKSAELWVNELRLTEFNEDGGWAGNANLYVGLSDLGTFNFTGRKETAGFGGLDQGIMERNLDDMHQYSLSAQMDFGRFFPKKAKVNIPFYYSYREEMTSPKYNPLDGDILLQDAIDAVETKAEKDSIRNMAQDKTTAKSIGFNGVRVNAASKKPMPYDPANLSMSYTYSDNNTQNATTQYDRTTENRLNVSYSYASPLKPWTPFKKKEKKDLGASTGVKPATNPVSVANKKPAKPSAFRKFADGIEIGLLPSTVTFTSDISRTYYEYQLRDLSNSGENLIPPSFREDFYWNRTSAIQWNLTKNLKFNFNSGTNAKIESPHVQVNKTLFPDEYKIWKDSVLQSLAGLGSPMEYKQNMQLSYNLPVNVVPLLSFIKAPLKYESTYQWTRGATVEDETVEIGNEIQNHRAIGLDNVTFNMVDLYNKVDFLKRANERYSGSARSGGMRQQTAARRNQQQQQGQQNRRNAQNQNQKKNFEQTITLAKDTTVELKHSLNNKRLRVTARLENGRKYELNYKTIDENSIRIKSSDSARVKITIAQLPPIEDEGWYKIAQAVSRGLMVVRNVSFSYNLSEDMIVPNFQPEAGDFFGQGTTAAGKAPGWDFAFGLSSGTQFLNRASDNGWLLKNSDNITPAMNNRTEKFDMTANLEPFAQFKIVLRANQTNTTRNQYYFMYDNMPPKITGNFTMTTISLKSAFGSANQSNGYYSSTFQKFLDNRDVIANRLEQVYAGKNYPDAGFLQGSGYAGQTYDPNVAPVDLNSTDVLIPAFIAAYTGRDANSVGLTAFPSLKNLLPNWDVTYDGLIRIPFINKYFKSFTLRHKYESVYSIGSYNSFLDWVGLDAAGDYGFSQNAATEIPFPTSPYDITSVTLREAFNPLLEVSSTFMNNASLALKYGTTRNVTLNVTAYQITEAATRDFTFATGYRFDNFNRILKMRKTGGKDFNNELKVDAQATYSLRQTLLRKIQDNYTQATEGQSNLMIKLSAEYALSKMVSVRAFYDRQTNRPLVSSTAYPISKSSFGLDIKISLTR